MIRVTVTTKVIDQQGQIDDETAIPHVGVADLPLIALNHAFEEAVDYISNQFDSMGTDTFDITVEISPVRGEPSN